MRVEAVGVAPVGARVPARVDAVADAGQPALVRPLGEQPVEAAAELGAGDLLGVGRADGGDMVGVDDPRLEEGDAAVELDAVEAEGGLGNGEVVEPRRVELALVREIVDRHHGRGLAAAPAQVAGGERGRPVVEMEDVGPPAVQAAHRQFGGGEAQPREADRVVGEFIAGGVGVGRAVAVVEFGAQDEIDDEPVGQGQRADRAGRDRAGARQMGDDVDRRHVAQRRTIGGQQHARVATGPQRARQRRRDFAKTARLEKVGGFPG